MSVLDAAAAAAAATICSAILHPADAAASPPPAADPLPLLRDVPAPDKPALFVRKLRLCAFSFDYSDPAAHVREKEVKRQTLLELVDYVNSGSGKFTEEVRVVVGGWVRVHGCGGGGALEHGHWRVGVCVVCDGSWQRRRRRPGTCLQLPCAASHCIAPPALFLLTDVNWLRLAGTGWLAG